ncbi:MAG: DNA mismatch repair protein MutL, partial [Lentimonas sp.]
FLKSDIVEFKHILNEFHRIVIPHHETHFILTQNGETIHNLPPANLRKRIIDLNGRNYTDRMVPVNESTDIVEINGFVCKPEFAKKSRGEQYLFVNNRFFKDSYFNNAVTRAFENLLQKSTYPGYYIFLTVDPEKIDVNVHPTKTEIKFEEDKFIYSILFSAIKEGLGKFNVMPSLDFEAETSFDVPQSVKSGFAHQPEIKVNSNYNPFTAKPTNSSSSNKSPSPAIRNAGITQQGGDTETTDWKDFYDVQEEKEEKNLEIDLDFTQENKPVLISGSYIMTTVKSGFMSLNYRRAQERIVYDELTSSFISQPIPSQGLLFPYDYEISKEEVLTWEENKKMTKQLGLVWTKNEKGISFTALPSVLQEENLPLFLSDFNEKINFATVEKGEIAHYIILSLAKASSMQSNLVTNKQSADEMIERLFACEDHTYSPSGKAIVKLLKHEQIEKI